MIVMVALMSLARVGVVMSIDSKDKIVAYYLAQDAMQYITSVQETDLREETTNFVDTLYGLCDAGGGSAGCTIDTTNPTVAAATVPCVSSCPRIGYDASAHTYRYSGSTTVFNRTVVISNTSGEEYVAHVLVEWQTESGVRMVEMYRYFYDINALI